MLGLLLALGGAAAAAGGEKSFALKDGERVLVLGDSITAAGMWVQYLEAYLATRFPERKYEVISLGLPSETVSGLSEPDHPYPRPCVHERVERALTKTRPTVVIACYGMNDGIYYPFAEERFREYQGGIDRLLERVRAVKARPVLITPPPFDPQPVRSVLLPLGAEKYSWVHPYSGYNDVLNRYARWLVTRRSHELPVADAHTEIQRVLTDLRKAEPNLVLAGDGVHPNASGEWPITQQLLLTLHAPAEADSAVVDATSRKVRAGSVREVVSEKGGVRFQWTSRLPMPYDPQWNPRLPEVERIGEQLNRYRLTVTGLKGPRYELREGDTRLAEVTGEQLSEGLDLLKYPLLSTNRRAAELLKLVQQRERLLAAAWLTDVGHKRPGTAVGLPLAEAQAKSAPLTEKIRELARPVPIGISVVPVAVP